MRDRAMSGTPGAPGTPNVSDIIAQQNRLNPGQMTTPGWDGRGTLGINQQQVAAMRDAALNGTRAPLPGLNAMGLPGSGAGGQPTIADIIFAQTHRFTR